MNLPYLSINLAWNVYEHLHLKPTPYELGAKAPSLWCDTSEIDTIDCSGFVRYLLARATHGKLIIPDGSANQHDWFEQNAPGKVTYDYACASRDRLGLYIAFIPVGQSGHGHVWFVHRGETWESSPSVNGVGSRLATTGILDRLVCACYPLNVKL